MLPKEIIDEVEAYLAEFSDNNQEKLLDMDALSGGSINSAFRIKTDQRVMFIKYNSKNRYPGMFEAEAKGLQLLRKYSPIRIPEVLKTGGVKSLSYILLEYISSVGRSPNYFEELGQGLAGIHRTESDSHGLDHDNYIGSLPQQNNQRESGIEFFWEERLRPMIKMARDMRVLSEKDSNKFEKLRDKLSDIIPADEPACLLHGDLWSGNVIVDDKGSPAIIDPAVYYGYREIDLAMTKLFGGFDQGFYGAYNDAYPLQPGWEERLELFNLYPLMVHVNLFGSSYLRQVKSVLNSFV